MTVQEKENLYLLAKQKYYEGESIMSDFEFDNLEEELKAINSQVTRIVGSQNLKDAKFNHASPMLSLNKIQVQRNQPLPIDSFDNWFSSNCPKSLDHTRLEATPKFDGSSCNLIYENGKLNWALTRGDKEKGQNIIEKMRLIVPDTIDIHDKVEIRGEVVIAVDTFNEKYSHIYKNPRNFVAGILGRDEISESIIKDFHFVAFETRVHTSSDYYHHSQNLQFLRENNFTVSPEIFTFDSKEFQSTYERMLHFRENTSPYQLDGFVIKFNESIRSHIGETDYAPKWAVAIKFPPKESITTIKKIQWSPGLSGEFTPIALLEPIDLDGTTVSNVNLHNYGNVIRQGLFPGAEVIIVKSGDIIPIVQKVINPVFDNIEKHIPISCTTPDCKIEVEGKIHLVCTNPNCTSKLINKLSHGIGTFNFRNVAGSTIKKLYAAGITSILDVFDNDKFNEANLIKSGEFKKGRQLEILMESRRNPVRKITLPLVITSLAFDDVGHSTAAQIAKLFTNENPNWSGLSSIAYRPFLDKESIEYKMVLQFIDILERNGFEIHSEEKPKISTNSIICEFTGSPKEFGFKTKDDYLNHIKQFGCIHGSLDKNCKYLVTDDINSSSSKMSKAKKLGVEIISYQDLIKKLDCKYKK
jgi:DNA ligase (NAD+)